MLISLPSRAGPSAAVSIRSDDGDVDDWSWGVEAFPLREIGEADIFDADLVLAMFFFFILLVRPRDV